MILKTHITSIKMGGVCSMKTSISGHFWATKAIWKSTVFEPTDSCLASARNFQKNVSIQIWIFFSCCFLFFVPWSLIECMLCYSKRKLRRIWTVCSDKGSHQKPIIAARYSHNMLSLYCSLFSESLESTGIGLACVLFIDEPRGFDVTLSRGFYRVWTIKGDVTYFIQEWKRVSRLVMIVRGKKMKVTRSGRNWNLYQL